MKRALLATLATLLPLALARTVHGDGIGEVGDLFWDCRDAMVRAAVCCEDADSAGALACLDEVEANLDAAEALLSPPGKTMDGPAVLKTIMARRKKLPKVRVTLGAAAMIPQKAFKAAASEAKAWEKAGSSIEPPPLGPTGSKGGGIFKPQTLQFHFHAPASCTGPFQVYLVERESENVVATWETDVGYDGVFNVTLGPDRGTALFQVSGCGQPLASYRLFNMGGNVPKPPPLPPGVPADFPANLPKGTYGLSYTHTLVCSDGTNFSDGPTSAGAIPHGGNTKQFYDLLKMVFDAAVAGAQQPGCVTTVVYSPVVNDSFTATIEVFCETCVPGEGCASCTSTITFTIAKQ